MESLDANEQFETHARTFCAVLEGPFGTGTEALRNIRDVLLPLYAAALALSLPSIETRDDLPGDTDGIWQERKEIGHRVQAAGFQDQFWVVFDPLKQDRDDPLISTLSDCLADIWDDLKPGILALDTNRDRYLKHAVWEWKFGFLSHWGRHAIDALRAIHFQLEDTE